MSKIDARLKKLEEKVNAKKEINSFVDLIVLATKAEKGEINWGEYEMSKEFETQWKKATKDR